MTQGHDDQPPTAPAAEDTDGDTRALQVELRAARQELARRDESLGRLVGLLNDCQQMADAHAATARDRIDALAAQVAALQSSRTMRWSAPARRTVRALGGWRRNR